jgi:hypothetical protein
MGARSVRLHLLLAVDHRQRLPDRYYSVQFTDPTSGANFAYVGKRTTGTATADFLLCKPQWSGDTPDGMTRIEVPHPSMTNRLARCHWLSGQRGGSAGVGRIERSPRARVMRCGRSFAR